MDAEKIPHEITTKFESNTKTYPLSDAPEVYHTEADSHNAPEVYRYESKLQPIYKDSKVGYGGAHAEPEVYHNKAGFKFPPGKRDARGTLAPEYYDQQQLDQRLPKPTFQKRRRLWLLLAAIALIIGLAVGLGVGLHSRSSNNNSASSIASTAIPEPLTSSSSSINSLSTSLPSSITPLATNSVSSVTSLATNSASSTSIISSSVTSSSTSTAPTSGTTGIAANDCRTRGTNTYTTNDNPTTFTFECGVDYPAGDAAFSGSGNVTDLSSHLVTYTFEQCIENCATYNKQNPLSTACVAITYNANLTRTLAESQHANCFLKNTRGKAIVDNADDLLHMASAYVTT